MKVESELETFRHLDMHERGTANDGGQGPEMEDEGHVHCLPKGPYFKDLDLVLNKDLFGILGP